MFVAHRQNSAVYYRIILCLMCRHVEYSLQLADDQKMFDRSEREPEVVASPHTLLLPLVFAEKRGTFSGSQVSASVSDCCDTSSQ